MIEFKEVEKRYPNGFEALKHINLTIDQGEFVAIIGLSGAGKSTLIRTINRMHDITQGQLTVDGTDVMTLHGKNLRKFRRRIGMIFQSFNLITRTTVIKNVLTAFVPDLPWWRATFGIFTKEEKMKALEALDQMGILDKAFVRADQLSGGQQQRVACARAIMARPSVIFADEPTGNLDSRTSREVLGFLKHSVHEYGQTIVMVTHDPRAASYADRVLVLADGRITQDLRHPTYQEILKVFASDDDVNADAMDYGAEDSKSADGKENARIAGTQVETHDADAHESNIEPTSNVDVPALVSPKLSIPKAEPFDARIGGNGAAA